MTPIDAAFIVGKIDYIILLNIERREIELRTKNQNHDGADRDQLLARKDEQLARARRELAIIFGRL